MSSALHQSKSKSLNLRISQCYISVIIILCLLISSVLKSIFLLMLTGKSAAVSRLGGNQTDGFQIKFFFLFLFCAEHELEGKNCPGMSKVFHISGFIVKNR